MAWAMALAVRAVTHHWQTQCHRDVCGVRIIMGLHNDIPVAVLLVTDNSATSVDITCRSMI